MKIYVYLLLVVTTASGMLAYRLSPLPEAATGHLATTSINASPKIQPPPQLIVWCKNVHWYNTPYSEFCGTPDCLGGYYMTINQYGYSGTGTDGIERFYPQCDGDGGDVSIWRLTERFQIFLNVLVALWVSLTHISGATMGHALNIIIAVSATVLLQGESVHVIQETIDLIISVRIIIV